MIKGGKRVKKVISCLVSLFILLSAVQVYARIEQHEFTYSENFDDVAVNALPIGWTVVGTNAIAKVENDALSLYSADQYSAKYILFDFDDVYRHYGTSNLTMECDIVRNAKNGGSNTFAGAGLAYGIELNNDGTIKNSSFVSANTEKINTNSSSQDYNKEYNIDLKDFGSTGGRNYIIRSGSNPPAESFNWDSKQPVHLKIELTNDTQSPEIYINGSRIIDPWTSKITDNSADRVLSGKIGLYFRNANVIIDNVVVSGTQNVDVKYYEDFKYEENFNSLANGTLPTGWTVVGSQIQASVQNNALLVDSWGNTDSYILFDYEDVLRHYDTASLTMECDITRNRAISVNSSRACVGFCYAVDYDNGTINHKSYVAPQTELASNYSKIAMYDFDASGLRQYNYILKSDNSHATQPFNWDSSTVHLKIELDDTTHSPIIYINGEELYDPWTQRFESTSDSRILSGRIGLYSYATNVTIDNVVITGTQEKDAPNSENSISVLSHKYSNDNIEASVRVKKTDDNTKDIYMAIYPKDFSELLKVSIIPWNSNYKDLRTNLKLEGIENFSLEDYAVRIYAWQTGNYLPVDTAKSLQ